MERRHAGRAWVLIALGALAWAVASGRGWAEPAEPVVAWIYPAGAQRGTTVEIRLGGQRLEGASAVRITGTGVTARVVPQAIPSAGPSGASPRMTPRSPSPGATRPSPAPAPRKAATADTSTLTLAVTVSADAEPGLRDLRVITPGGASNRVILAIGTLPEIREGTNHGTPSTAQLLDRLPVVVNGQIMEGERDFYRVRARSGQTLVCRVEARVLHPFLADGVPGWCDPCLALYDANGHLLQEVDDTRLQPDPVLTWRAPRDGDYLVEVRDVLYRGRVDFVYRMAVGSLPHLNSLFPLGGQRGKATRVTLDGVNLSVPQVEVRLPREGPSARAVQAEGQGASSNAIPFGASDEPSVMEVEPNDSLKATQPLVPPVVVEGRVDRPGDVDFYSFPVRKGQAVRLEIVARRLGSTVDSVLTLFDARGRRLAENDDPSDPRDGTLVHQADSLLIYTPQADGTLVVRVRDAQRKGGPDCAYRLVVAPAQPDFSLRVTPDRVRGARGDQAVLTVEAQRTNGFKGPIELAVKGLPGGCQASTAVIDAGQDRALLTVGLAPRLALGAFAPTVVGAARIGERKVERPAVPTEEVMQAFSNRQTVPTSELVVAVTETDGTTLALGRPPSMPLEIPQGGQVSVTVRVVRGKDIKGGMALRGQASVNGVGVRGAWIPAEKDEATLLITAGPKVPVGTQGQLVLTGSLRAGKESCTRTLPAISIRITGKR